MKAMTREYVGPATVGGLSLSKVRIQEGVEESAPVWVNPGEPVLEMRWWEGEASGDDPAILRSAWALPDGPVEVILPTGRRAMAYVAVDVPGRLDDTDTEWQISLQGAGPSPLS
ncbi:hypothetical protein ACFCYM_09800 [Streptomyces sp. NPDC056254]|uniref:hypothetical protein n=1 Tax=Streptomyces sp. NPDC056254 TaxID=3345763 RepID=UPI0035D85BB5